jgi:hypothetical protein
MYKYAGRTHISLHSLKKEQKEKELQALLFPTVCVEFFHDWCCGLGIELFCS